jgi:hypothetical protein
VQDVNIVDGHAFLYKVKVDLDMLRALVLNVLEPDKRSPHLYYITWILLLDLQMGDI